MVSAAPTANYEVAYLIFTPMQMDAIFAERPMQAGALFNFL